MKQFEIRYKKILSLFCILLSAAIVGFHIIFGFSFNIILAVLVLAPVYFLLKIPMAVITEHGVFKKNIYGMNTKTFLYTPGDIRITDEGVFVKGEKVISPLFADYDPDKIKVFLREISVKEET